jgi:hypothetical protein
MWVLELKVVAPQCPHFGDAISYFLQRSLNLRSPVASQSGVSLVYPRCSADCFWLELRRRAYRPLSDAPFRLVEYRLSAVRSTRCADGTRTPRDRVPPASTSPTIQTLDLPLTWRIQGTLSTNRKILALSNTIFPFCSNSDIGLRSWTQCLSQIISADSVISFISRVLRN